LPEVLVSLAILRGTCADMMEESSAGLLRRASLNLAIYFDSSNAPLP
jgi:hypothetical protein